jgi:hypothetical protein
MSPPACSANLACRNLLLEPKRIARRQKLCCESLRQMYAIRTDGDNASLHISAGATKSAKAEGIPWLTSQDCI